MVVVGIFLVSVLNLAAVSLIRIEQPIPSDRDQDVKILETSYDKKVTDQVYSVNEFQNSKELPMKEGHPEADSRSKPSLEKDFIHDQQKHPNPKRYTRIRQLDPIPKLIEELKQNGVGMNKHIHQNHLHQPNEVTLLVMVESLPSSRSWRQTIRDTWGSAMPSGSFFVFVVPFYEAKEEESLLEESEQFTDIVLFKLTHQSTTSSVKIMQYLFWCDKLFTYKYLLRTTDKYFLMIDILLRSLGPLQPYDKIYMGYFKGNVNVSSEDTAWFVCPTLVPHADEGMYLLSRPLIKKFLKHFWALSYFQSEGASVGLWASPFKNIKLLHRVDFDTKKSRGCSNSLVGMQELSEESMRTRYARVLGGGDFCSEEFELVKSYKYDWSTIPSRCCHGNEPK